MFDFEDKEPNRNKKMLSFENLMIAIEQLESDGIINFDDFKLLPFTEIRKNYFAMPNATLMRKAIIKIEDKRNGETDLSTHISITNIYQDGKLIKVRKRISRF